MSICRFVDSYSLSLMVTLCRFVSDAFLRGLPVPARLRHMTLFPFSTGFPHFHRVFHSLRFKGGKRECLARHAEKMRAARGHIKIVYKSAGQRPVFLRLWACRNRFLQDQILCNGRKGENRVQVWVSLLILITGHLRGMRAEYIYSFKRM